MEHLFTARMSKPAVPVALTLPFAGFLALSFGIPFIGTFALAMAGLLSLYILFGKQGITYTFSKPEKPISTYFFGLISAYLFAGIGVFSLKCQFIIINVHWF